MILGIKTQINYKTFKIKKLLEINFTRNSIPIYEIPDIFTDLNKNSNLQNWIPAEKQDFIYPQN